MCFDDTSVYVWFVFFFSSRRRHTRCALVTGVQTCAFRSPVGLFCAFVCWQGLKTRETPMRKLPVDGIGLGLLIVWVGALQILQIGRASCRERVCQYV